MATRLIQKPFAFKRCQSCNEEKPVNEFEGKRETEAGIRSFVRANVCIECDRVDSQDKKYCHCCLRYKPLDNFRKFVMGSLNQNVVVEANNCKECEAKGAKEKKYVDVLPIAIDPSNIDYHCAFIGNASYKDICKVYKIKY